MVAKFTFYRFVPLIPIRVKRGYEFIRLLIRNPDSHKWPVYLGLFFSIKVIQPLLDIFEISDKLSFKDTFVSLLHECWSLLSSDLIVIPQILNARLCFG